MVYRLVGIVGQVGIVALQSLVSLVALPGVVGLVAFEGLLRIAFPSIPSNLYTIISVLLLGRLFTGERAVRRSVFSSA